MLSSNELESLIIVKRREIEKEKLSLGLIASQIQVQNTEGRKEDYAVEDIEKENSSQEERCKCTEDIQNDIEEKDRDGDINKHNERETEEYINERIPAGLERYIRRYLGLPVMLKAGEYSPNNPLIRGERTTGDVLLGLGEYERRRNTLRKLQQKQYREYLDQQAKKKQEDKEQAERERKEREEKERQKEEEREKARLFLEQDSNNDRIASVCYVPEQNYDNFVVVRQNKTKVDTGVQVGNSMPQSVAVQTDDEELFNRRSSPSPPRRTPAERELSPRAVSRCLADCALSTRRSTRDKLTSDLRHTYMPSIFDAEAINIRNQQAEKVWADKKFLTKKNAAAARRSACGTGGGPSTAPDLSESEMKILSIMGEGFGEPQTGARVPAFPLEALERRQFYQQELKHQIQEQQRIREERRVREQMLEQAELRRVEEQLRVLKEVNEAMNENATEFNTRRSKLQREIDLEQQKFLRTKSQPTHSIVKRNINTSHSDNKELQQHYDRQKERRKPYSSNIPENSIFSENYDVDSYLRKNLNPTRRLLDFDIRSSGKSPKFNIDIDINNDSDTLCEKQTIVEKALIHDHPRERKWDRPKYEPSILKNLDIIERKDLDDTPIPVLRHSPNTNDNEIVSVDDKMKLVEDKWQVPAVQKNILKTLPSEKGKSVNILTQLGSIRRQLQLEQLKLDKAGK